MFRCFLEGKYLVIPVLIFKEIRYDNNKKGVENIFHENITIVILGTLRFIIFF